MRLNMSRQDKLRRALYNAKFTTDAEDENPFVGVYFNDLLDIIKDYVEQPLIDKACEWLDSYFEDGYDLCNDFRRAMEE